MTVYEFNTAGYPTLSCTYSPGEGMDILTVETITNPDPEFWKAWNKLPRYFELAMKLPENHGWKIDPIKLTRSDKGAQLTAMIDIPGNPNRVKIPTPFYKEDDKKPTMETEMYEIFQLVLYECEAFAKGKRAQIEIFENQETESSAPAFGEEELPFGEPSMTKVK